MTLNVDAQFLMYGTKSSRDSKSGAYLFIPDGPAQVFFFRDGLFALLCTTLLFCTAGVSVLIGISISVKMKIHQNSICDYQVSCAPLSVCLAV